MSEQLFDDEREISAIVFGDESTITAGGLGGVTRIDAYKEAGECGYVPWFSVWRGDKLIQRVNGKFVATVMYR